MKSAAKGAAYGAGAGAVLGGLGGAGVGLATTGGAASIPLALGGAAEVASVGGQLGLSVGTGIGFFSCAPGSGGGGSGGGGGQKTQNKINHLFGKSQHNLDLLVRTFGSKEAAYQALEDATEKQVGQNAGQFTQQVQVGGYNVTVAGKIVNGVAEIGTAYIKGGGLN